jgi:hypothetical protein
MTFDTTDIILIVICLVLSIGVTIILNRHKLNCTSKCKSNNKNNSIIYKEIYDI